MNLRKFVTNGENLNVIEYFLEKKNYSYLVKSHLLSFGGKKRICTKQNH